MSLVIVKIYIFTDKCLLRSVWDEHWALCPTSSPHLNSAFRFHAIQVCCFLRFLCIDDRYMVLFVHAHIQCDHLPISYLGKCVFP